MRKKLLYLLAVDGLKAPNISNLAGEIETSRATVMKVMPSPCSGFGTMVYAIFSRMAARATIAKSQPMPEPSA